MKKQDHSSDKNLTNYKTRELAQATEKNMPIF